MSLRRIAPLPLLLFSACGLFGGSGSVDLSGLPELSSLESAPLETFLLDSEGQAHVTRTQPFMGSATGDSTCQHDGAHLHFEDTGSDYEFNILAPAAGTISHVDPCHLNGDHDKYDLWLTFAQKDGEAVDLELSIEPMAGQLCSGGIDGADNGEFAPFIDVAEGDEVAAGDVIARFTRRKAPASEGDGAHIHYALLVGESKLCPDVFDSSLRSWAFSLFDLSGLPAGCTTTDGTEAGAFCENATADESPF